MSLTRRKLLGRTAGLAMAATFGDVLGLDRVLTAHGAQCSATYRGQLDGSYCCAANCGPTSSAMLRSVQSCGLNKPTGASMRIWGNYFTYPYTACGSHTYGGTCATSPCSDGQSLCPDQGTTFAFNYNALMNPRDGGKKYYTVNYGSGITWTKFTSLISESSGYSAMVAGNNAYNNYNCSNYKGPHFVFVRRYFYYQGSYPNQWMFEVYDPNNSSRNCSFPPQPELWTTSDMWQFLCNFSGSCSNPTPTVQCIAGNTTVVG